MEVLQSLVVLLCLFGQFSAIAYEGCRIRYGRRGCYDKILTGVLVTCDGNNVEKEIPTNIPADTIYISLVNFKLANLTRANFTGLRTVECMNILNSGVDLIEYDTFSDLENLHELELINTNLRSVDMQFLNHPEFRAKWVSISGANFIDRLGFNGTETLQKLQVLVMDENQIEFVDPSIIHHLKQVEKLSFRQNSLKSIEWSKLTSLEHLNRLLLDGNRFQTIPSYVENTFLAVKELKLANNPFHCNCKLKWLKDFYEYTTDKLLDYDAVVCASPFKRRMIDAFEEDFVCDRPIAPVIHFEPLNEEHTEFIVNCSSTADPAPTLTLTFPDTRRLVTPPHDDLSKLETSSPRILTSPGTILCEAHNSEGTTTTTASIPHPASSGSVTSASGIMVLAMTIMAMTGYIVRS